MADLPVQQVDCGVGPIDNETVAFQAARGRLLYAALVAQGINPEALAADFRGQSLVVQWRDGHRSTSSLIEQVSAMARVNANLRLPSFTQEVDV